MLRQAVDRLTAWRCFNKLPGKSVYTIQSVLAAHSQLRHSVSQIISANMHFTTGPELVW
mgnify:CR=1 FL=1|jgi:hypothetical protein